MGKTQQSRGRAARRYQKSLHKRRKRHIPVNWSRIHREFRCNGMVDLPRYKALDDQAESWVGGDPVVADWEPFTMG